jgi:hypothetical protein
MCGMLYEPDSTDVSLPRLCTMFRGCGRRFHPRMPSRVSSTSLTGVYQRFEHMLTTFRLNEFFPHSPNPRSFLKSEITADIHTDRDFKRHTESLDQAEKEGNLLYRAEADPATRRMGISLVKQQETSTGTLVENEIFGPVLPIIAVKVKFNQSYRPWTDAARISIGRSSTSMKGPNLWLSTSFRARRQSSIEVSLKSQGCFLR